MIHHDPVVLDASFLIAYDRMRHTDQPDDLAQPQSSVTTWLVHGVPLIVPALSLLAARLDCGGQMPEVDFLLNGDPELVLVVPLSREAAGDLAAAALKQRSGNAPDLADLEREHVVWCATGQDIDGALTRWPVATYEPGRYAGRGVPVVQIV